MFRRQLFVISSFSKVQARVRIRNINVRDYLEPARRWRQETVSTRSKTSSFDRYGEDRDRRPYRSSVKCFNCDETGHYANQCPHRERRYYSNRLSTSSDSRRARSPRRFDSQKSYTAPKEETELRERVAKLTKGVATIKEHFDVVQAKIEEKVRRKMEKARALEEERLKQEEEDAHLAQEVAQRDRCDIKEKKQVILEPEHESESEYSSEGSETSVTQELSEKTGRLCITEKRKRSDDVPIGDSPPMKAPLKCTPMRGCVRMGEHCQRVARAKTKGTRTPIRAKKHSPIKTPLSKLTKNRKLSPPRGKLTSSSKSLSRLRFCDSIMKELKDCNAEELQRYCKDEGIPYVGKIDVIFDLAEHRVQLRFPCIIPTTDIIHISESKDVEADASTENLE
ncbi:hypothetical protein CBR_g38008 [Chara braunii]|uniref:CCHC-type domain-containing protein n=1 Tax=Chara braunii TaxID=69332 RepID=A0A388K045_CHABU|nr:hypothetical protein CBR_g38008 [Chara braunii]|eukprot:GBG63386.1 hypothetical protein CBR_g38008 [Chara braunii]